ncbi:hypothetical protein [Aquimarina sp. 2201CG5-10]|uniref:hypothetical protein n=1 Tax=Aquimarina callyspongiae TaxID=3098150 RepID=UPI002AB410FA|nr:hypothetical protein [Aquimarina sp. 2201CG5-10]MDY8138131.1 hypothetical protein [Aquimarina sp. 2201CG5-10]
MKSLKKNPLILTLVCCCIVAFLIIGFKSEKKNDYINTPTDAITFSNQVPNGPEKNATKDELYTFAWKQFAALNWPAQTPNKYVERSTPSNHADSSFYSVEQKSSENMDLPLVVWSTFASKAEMFGPKYNTSKNKQLPAWKDIYTPSYSYSDQPTSLSSTPSSKYTLFNNLDENDEIGEAKVYGGSGKGSKTGGNQILYEAKVNQVEYDYIREFKLQNKDIVQHWSANTKSKLNKFGGTCKTEEASREAVICFPCADTSSEGVIEIKAAWRALTNKDKADRFYTKQVIVYEEVKGKIKYTNKIYALVGLHIIRKTKHHPTLIFTTFNHVDNINNGIYYENTLSDQGKHQYYKKDKTGHPKPYTDAINGVSNPQYTIPSGYQSVKNQDEIHTIPTDLTAFNKKIQKQISGKNKKSVWQYYELLGVQAIPVDYDNITIENIKTTYSSYYLANDVIETDYTLRKFTGTFGPRGVGILLETDNITVASNPDLVTPIELPPKRYAMGGCMGCHGNAQQGGTDFSFLLGGGPLQKPAVLDYSITTSPEIEKYIKEIKN